MSRENLQDAVAGALAGLAGGLVYGLILTLQVTRGSVALLLDSASLGTGILTHLAVAGLAGTGFGILFRWEQRGYAVLTSSGLVYGLLWWIMGPLTLAPLIEGESVSWSLSAASGAFPDLIGHLVYGGITGVGFFLLRPTIRFLMPAAAGEDAAPTRRVLIVGGGFAGIAAARELERLLSREPGVEIVLSSESNYLLFTPLLPEVASGALQPEHVSAPLRAALGRTRVVRGECLEVDAQAREVRLRPAPGAETRTLAYDHLILAVGAVPTFHGIEGVEERALTMKTLPDAMRLRNRVISLLEQADVEDDPERRRRLLTFVVAGGGFAGAEVVAELHDLVRSALRFYHEVDASEPRFVLVHAGSRILPELSPEMAEYATGKLERRGIEVVLDTRVRGADAGGVDLDDGSRIPAPTLVWTAGNRPHPLVRSLAREPRETGTLAVDTKLGVPGRERLWALGDCARVPLPGDTERACAPTAQHARQQGRKVAENCAAALRGESPSPYRYTSRGTLVGLGYRAAVAEIGSFRFSGRLAWFLWRTVYLAKLPGLEKKLRVALDWTVDLFFPRSISEIRALDRPEAAAPEEG